jgi:hypothetical protein
MEHMDLETYIYGLSTFGFIIISVVVGILFLSKYRIYPYENEGKTMPSFFWIGLAWLLMSSPWWGSLYTFLMATLELDALSYPIIPLFLSNFFLPIAVAFWFKALTHLINFPSLSVKFSSILIVIANTILIIALIIDPNIIGTIVSISYWYGSSYTILIQLISLFTFVITGLWFTKESYKRIKKAKKSKRRILFLSYAFIIFLTACIFDSAFLLDTTSLVIIRIILATSAISFYFAFFSQA